MGIHLKNEIESFRQYLNEIKLCCEQSLEDLDKYEEILIRDSVYRNNEIADPHDLNDLISEFGSALRVEDYNFNKRDGESLNEYEEREAIINYDWRVRDEIKNARKKL